MVELGAGATSLGGVTVEARDLSRSWLGRQGFFDRRTRSRGTFLTRSDIAQKGAASLGEVLFGELGLVVQSQPAGWQVTTTSRGGCRPVVYLDGAPATWLAEDLSRLAAAQIAAIEIYRVSTEVPFQYGGGRSCGAIVVWTLASTEGPDAG